jgi:hypothetical protein
MVILGVDPGLDGACSILSDRAAPFFLDTPTIEVQGAKRSHREIDAAGIVDLLMRSVGRDAEVQACIEKVSAAPIAIRGRGVSACPTCGRSPSPGVTSSFNFGAGFGIWKGVLAGLQIPVTLVHPATWKAAMLRDMPKGKGASILRAKQLYPGAAGSLNLKKHHGRADALLLAHYLWMKFHGQVREPKSTEFKLVAEELPF